MVNVCLLTARDEEALEAKTVFDKDGFEFKQFSEPELGFNFWESRNKENITFFMAFAHGQGNNGTIDIANKIFSYLEEKRNLKLDMVFMTGVAAGKRDDTQLGDVLVASYSFDCTNGEINNDEVLTAPDQYGPPAWFLDHIKMQMYNEKDFFLKEGPTPKNFAKEWVLRTHYEFYTSADGTKEESDWLKANGFTNFKSIVKNDCVKLNAPNYKDLVGQFEKDGKLIENEDLDLVVSKEVVLEIKRALRVGDYPSPAPAPTPKVLYEPWMCGSAVESKTVDGGKSAAFAFAERVDRKIIGIDMESAAFYKATKYANIPSLCVKGVSDHGDALKDDSFHTYGKHISASYVLSIIKKNVSFSSNTTTNTGIYWIICNDDYIQTVRQVYEDQGIVFGQPSSFKNSSFAYIQGEITIKNKAIQVYLSSTKGNLNAIQQAYDVFKTFKPTLTIMVGVCSSSKDAKPEPPQICDLLIGTRSFNYTTGKQTNEKFKPGDVHYYEAHNSLIQTLRNNLIGDKFFELVKDDRLYKQQWLLKVIVEYEKPNSSWLKEQGFDQSKSLLENKNPMVQECYRSNIHQTLINTRKIYQEASSGNLKPTDAGREEANALPEVNKSTSCTSKIRYGGFASGTAFERRDSKIVIDKDSNAYALVSTIFKDMTGRDCSVIGIDQESASFYQAANNFNINAVVMKAVADYADSSNQTSDTLKLGNAVAASYSFDAFKSYFESI